MQQACGASSLGCPAGSVAAPCVQCVAVNGFVANEVRSISNAKQTADELVHFKTWKCVCTFMYVYYVFRYTGHVRRVGHDEKFPAVLNNLLISTLKESQIRGYYFIPQREKIKNFPPFVLW